MLAKVHNSCERVVKVRRKIDRVMTIVLTFGETVVRVICAYGPQVGKSMEEKHRFYDDLACEWSVQSTDKLDLSLGDFNGHVGKQADGFEDVHGGNSFGVGNYEGRLLLEFCSEKELCVAKTWF